MKQIRWILILVALLAGWFMPDFYDWSGEDQSRSAPVVRWIGLGILLFNATAIGWLLWKFFKEPAAQSSSAWREQFGIRHVLIATTLVALVVAGERMLKVPLVNGLALAGIAYAIWLAWKQPLWRWDIVTLIVCMWGPLVWIFRWPEFRNNLGQILIMSPGLPALLPAAWFNHLIGVPMLRDMTTPGLFTLAGLLTGVWLTRFGQRTAAIAWLVALTVALVSSFGLQALVRA